MAFKAIGPRLICRANNAMKQIEIGNGRLNSSRLAYGCWRIAGTWDPAGVTPQSEAEGRRAVIAAYEAGYTLYDLADIYCAGVTEWIFGQVLQEVSGMRQQVLITTKCGIRKAGDPQPASPYRYDFSAKHIVWSCEQSLKRLGVEMVDLFQLHRPDYLGDPEEVAGAFSQLQQSGKAQHFGVSNFRPSQLAALQRACPMPLLVNQVEISLARLDCFDDGTLDQCLAEKITPLAWSPLGGGHLADGAKQILASQQDYGKSPVLKTLDDIAHARNATRPVVALAWLLRHPGGIVPIVGSTSPARIREAARATDLELTRDEWYQLLGAARGRTLP